MSPLALAAFCLLLALAAASDIARYRIPNPLCVALAVGALILAFPHDLSEGLSRGASLLLIGGAALGLYLGGLLGGGDAKLLMAAALWMPVQSLPAFLTALAVAGGVQAGVVLAARAAAGPDLPRRGARMPYGVSIAAAGFVWALLQWSAA
ncbi:prepilin peptidase [Phenylobacterium sp.]|uniref:prepilin peptidase n=1 Tax=Phenylobacterium sp. TaxID=1871053 RepID=UPI002DEE60A7|nr:prepilin peptidase [Phenylobacterium sp.]